VAPIPNVSASSRPPYSTASATVEANAMLARIVPAGGTRVASLPGGLLPAPPMKRIGDEVVDVDTLWTVPGSGAAFLAGIKAHPPASLTLDGWTGGGSMPLQSGEFGPGLGKVGPAVLISAVTAGDHAAVRVDVQVDWLPPRPDAENIPASVTQATLDWVGPDPALHQPVGTDTTPVPSRAYRVLTGGQLSALVTDLNALLPEPDGGGGCFGYDGGHGTITVEVDGHQVVFVVQIAGCGGVNVTSDGQAEPYLSVTPELVKDLYASIGVTEAPIPSQS
jgi:hypothetical protein